MDIIEQILDNFCSTDGKRLDPEQKKHIIRIINIYKNYYPAAYDFSEKGMGKMWVGIAISIVLDLPIFLIGNKQSLPQWNRQLNNFGAKYVALLHYEALRGVRTSKSKSDPVMSHNYLTRKGDQYTATPELIELIEKGCLIIIDESHRARNVDRVTFESCSTIVSKLIEMTNADKNIRSRILLSSATPSVDVDNITSILTFLGVLVKNNELYIRCHGHPTRYTGFKEMREWCINNVKNIKWDLKDKSLLEGNPHVDQVPHIALEIYTKYISPMLTSRIESDLPFKQQIINAFFKLDNQNDIASFRAANMHNRHRKGVKINTTSNNTTDSMVTRQEILRTKIVIPFTKSILIKNNMAKVIIYCNYDETQRIIYEGLKDCCNVSIVDGKTEDPIRHDVINRFNQDNDEVQVLISKATVCGTSIDLDDQFGNRPRYTLVMPSYNYIDNYQSYGRTCRRGTKSQPHVYIIYIDGVNESSLVASNTRKGRMLETIASGRHDVKDIISLYFDQYDICDGKEKNNDKV